MKRLFSLISAIVISLQALPCNCQPWSETFFDNIKTTTSAGLFRIDSTWFDYDTATADTIAMARFTVLKSYSLVGLKAGDKVNFFGQNGVNCAVGFMEFQLGDTIMASIYPGYRFQSDTHLTQSIPIYSPTGCGKHYLIIKNKQNQGKPLDVLEDELVNQYLSGIAVEDKTELFIHPNPVNNVLFIAGLSGIPDQINIYAISGNMVASSLPFNNGKLDVGNLESGVYFLEIVKDSGRITKRFLKN